MPRCLAAMPGVVKGVPWIGMVPLLPVLREPGRPSGSLAGKNGHIGTQGHPRRYPGQGCGYGISWD